ncbi:FTR1 family iron permease [Consotaella salsifontis]|uniref:High-affinity iron transporter n=1 Tax=Consotaella salsifontis TaxID=1365950 RepID=A0A1T4MUW0_9HYPH|nr:FTR1 family protein [Consotaella salsifontis]SJZ70634.1 high-affinity iron transporter [Consotaella salsifontis]
MRRLAWAFLLLLGLAIPNLAHAAPDYRSLVSRIDQMLGEAETAYRAGEADKAKTLVQRSYFELFENLEGPIRVNVSAKASYALEAEFGDIRQLIVDGKPVDEVADRIEKHIAALNAVVPTLEQGFVITAEPTAHPSDTASSDAAPQEPVQVAAPQTIEPYWERAVARITDDLNAAADALEAGDAAKAKNLIKQAQFDGYKNSLLETAVRRFVSQQQDIEYNAEFERILGLAEDGREPRLIRGSAKVLAADMTSHLPGLPLVGAAKEEAQSMPAPETDWSDVAGRVNAAIASAIEVAQGGNQDQAVAMLSDAYFDVFEASGMENRIGARDAALKTTLEGHFSKLMALVGSKASDADLSAEANAMVADLDRAVSILQPAGGSGPWALFGYALLILLREGFEAILIVTAITAYLVKTGHGDKQGVILNSVVVALLASVVTAVLLKLVFAASAASQEVLEGATMLFAAVILFSMSYWLISKAEAAHWSSYIREKVQGSLSSGSMRALWLTSFLAVYREGAETVLFYQALTIGADTSGLLAIAGGFVLGAIGLAFVYWAMKSGALRLPIRAFFQGTGALLYIMAFIFVGKGVMELVEGKVFSPTLIPHAPEIQALGIYPYWESMIPQALLVVAAAVAFIVIARAGRSSETSPASAAQRG